MAELIRLLAAILEALREDRDALLSLNRTVRSQTRALRALHERLSRLETRQ